MQRLALMFKNWRRSESAIKLATMDMCGIGRSFQMVELHHR